MGEMRRPTFYRTLRPSEQKLAKTVFDRSLPAWDRIGIGDGLGMGGDPWTDDGPTDYPQLPFLNFQMNIGDAATADLTSTDSTRRLLGGDYGRLCDLFVHEMVHVWQYHHGFWVKPSSIWAHTVSRYEFDPGDAWDDYNKEQQATIVEQWHKNGMSRDDELYPYVRLVIRTGGMAYPRQMTLKELARDVADLRGRGLD